MHSRFPGWLFCKHPEGMPRNDPFDRMEAEHPEFVMMRDAAVLFKFLTSMLPVQQELLMLQSASRRERYSLAFETDAVGGRMLSKRMDKKFFFSTLRVFGRTNNKAHITIHGYGFRRLVWGKGSTLSSPADVSSILHQTKISEEDVLHTDELPRFNDTLSYEESESLMSYLTVPYCRVPLVSHFFADLQPNVEGKGLTCGSRATFLFNEKLQRLFKAVLLEQGPWLGQRAAENSLIERVPKRTTRKQDTMLQQQYLLDARLQQESVSLGTPTGSLLNELRYSPSAVLKPMLEILKFTNELSAVSVHSASANFILYVLSLAVTVEAYLVDSLSKPELASSRAELKTYKDEISGYLRGPMHRMLMRWLREAADEISSHEREEDRRRNNIPTMVVVHAYNAVLWSNLTPEEFTVESVSQLLGSLAFVRGNHCYGQVLRIIDLSMEDHRNEKKVRQKVMEQLDTFLQANGIDTTQIDPDYLRRFCTGAPVVFTQGSTVLRVPLRGMSSRSAGFAAPPMEVPEDQLAYIVQSKRRVLVNWLSNCSEDTANQIMHGVVQIRLLGQQSGIPAAGWKQTSRGIWRAGDGHVIVNVQCAEVLYKDSEFRPVPDAMAAFADFEQIFGKEALQCAVKFTHQNRRWVEIIGVEFELMHWTHPDWKDQGVCAPSPVPSLAIPQDPPRERVRSLLASLQGHLLSNNPMRQPSISGKIVALYFGAHWCPPCEQFKPQLMRTYQSIRQNRQDFEVVYVSAGRTQAEFNQNFSSMPWLAVDFANGALRQSLQTTLNPAGSIPALVIVNAADGQIVNANARGAAAQDSSGQNFPWGTLVNTGGDTAETDGITYCGQTFIRPYPYYLADQNNPPPAPAPSEVWVKELLTPVLEALFPPNPPSKKMDYKLYMPTAVLPDDARTARLIAMAWEGPGKEGYASTATWKEIVLLRDWGVVHCYNLVSHGRRMYRQLVWSSNSAIALHSMDPMYLKPVSGGAPEVLLHASGDWKKRFTHLDTLVIARTNRELHGRETLLPSRNLLGVVPGVLLDAFEFWQGEDLIIRGSPRSSLDDMFNYNVEIKTVTTVDGEINTHIRRFPKTQAFTPITDEQDLPPPPPLVRVKSTSFNKSASPRQRGSPAAESDDLPTRPLLQRGYSNEDASRAIELIKQTHGYVDYDLAEQYLELITAPKKPTPPSPKTPSPKKVAPPLPPSAATVVAPKPSMMRRQLSAAAGAGTTLAGETNKPSDAGSMADLFTTHNLFLLNLLYAPRSSPLFRLGQVLSRIENFSHILVWTLADTTAADAAENIRMIDVIELPRLKLRFRPDVLPNGEVRMMCLSRAGFFISDSHCVNAGTQPKGVEMLSQLVSTIPHSLILENNSGDLVVLAPNHEMRRPVVKDKPFSSELIFHRSSNQWKEVMHDTPIFLYPVHTSRTILLAKTLDAALYLIVLNFIRRDYERAFTAAEALTIDVEFTPTEAWIFNLLGNIDDCHPDAHATRLKLILALQYSSNEYPKGWDVSSEMERYLKKLSRVSGACRLTPAEERNAIALCKDKYPHVRVRSYYHTALEKSRTVAQVKPPLPFIGGQPWEEGVRQVGDEVLDREQMLSKFYYEDHMEKKTIRDAEAATIVFESLLMDDQESGVSRRLGFLFLYQLIKGQV